MNDAVTNNGEAKIWISENGVSLTYSPKTDARIVDCIDGKVQCRTMKAAREIANEMRAWGFSEARTSNYAVLLY